MALDAEGIERHVGSASRTLAKNVKFFEKNKLTGCLSIAKQVKESVEEFKPCVPVVLSLCNPGMRERHWDNLNNTCNTKIKVDEKLTLDDIMEVSERSERALRKTRILAMMMDSRNCCKRQHPLLN